MSDKPAKDEIWQYQQLFGLQYFEDVTYRNYNADWFIPRCDRIDAMPLHEYLSWIGPYQDHMGEPKTETDFVASGMQNFFQGVAYLQRRTANEIEAIHGLKPYSYADYSDLFHRVCAERFSSFENDDPDPVHANALQHAHSHLYRIPHFACSLDGAKGLASFAAFVAERQREAAEAMAQAATPGRKSVLTDSDLDRLEAIVRSKLKKAPFLYEGWLFRNTLSMVKILQIPEVQALGMPEGALKGRWGRGLKKRLEKACTEVIEKHGRRR